MNKIIFLLAVFYLANVVKAQNVGINATGAAPNASAMLDVSSTNKGVLIPSMTSAQRLAIPGPANGLLVFDTNLNCTMMYLTSTGSWRSLCDTYGPFYTQTTTLYNPVATTLKTLNVTTTATTDKILIEAEFDFSKGTGNAFVAIGLFRNGVEIHEVSNYSIANADNSIKLTWVDVPGSAATHVYTIRFYSGGGTISGIYGSNLIASLIP